jgi:hypothetical protein|tara:strand:- start:4212 stop:4916 length:705 start_codon:yes stop_codon:yes gene_type:complete
MGLPIQKAPKFKCELSGGKVVEYRPFLVKEQKYLLIAKESEDNLEILEAIKNLVTAVTDGKVNSDELPIYDLEYLFLQIRAKSVGESVKISLYCREDDCNGSGSTSVDLSSVEVADVPVVDNRIELNETLGVTLHFPSTRQLALVDQKTDDGDRIIELLKFGIESIYDEESVYEASDISDTEIVEFIENLTLDQLEKLSGYFENIPSIEKVVDFKCDSCGKQQSSTLRGLSSFF